MDSVSKKQAVRVYTAGICRNCCKSSNLVGPGKKLFRFPHEFATAYN